MSIPCVPLGYLENTNPGSAIRWFPAASAGRPPLLRASPPLGSALRPPGHVPGPVAVPGRDVDLVRATPMTSA
jgi:hypothetical protein